MTFQDTTFCIIVVVPAESRWLTFEKGLKMRHTLTSGFWTGVATNKRFRLKISLGSDVLRLTRSVRRPICFALIHFRLQILLLPSPSFFPRLGQCTQKKLTTINVIGQYVSTYIRTYVPTFKQLYLEVNVNVRERIIGR